MSGKHVSVLNVVDDFFGADWVPESIWQVPRDKIDDLAENVTAFYSGWSMPRLNGTEWRCYGGGSTFLQPGAWATPFVASAVLYAQTIVMNCPLEAWFNDHRGHFRAPRDIREERGKMILTNMPAAEINNGGFARSTEEETKLRLERDLKTLQAYRIPIDNGWLIPVPHLKIWAKHESSVWTATRHDVNSDEFQKLARREWPDGALAVSDNMRGLGVTIPGGKVDRRDRKYDQVEPASLYFNRTLMVATETESRFTTTVESDYELLKYKLGRASLLKKELRDCLLLGALDDYLLPGVTENQIKVISSIRDNELAFAEWRTGLGELTQGKAIPSATSHSEAKELIKESLDCHFEKLDQAITRDRTLSTRFSRARPDVIDMGTVAVSAFFSSPAALFTGLPLVLKAALQAFLPSTSAPTSVLVKLRRARVLP